MTSQRQFQRTGLPCTILFVDVCGSTQIYETLGNARAQAVLGFMYEFGRGIPQDYVLAARWYLRAAAQGEPHGQHLLGLLYDKGRGVPEDAVEAYKWLNLAAARAGLRDRDYYIRMRDAIASKMDRYSIAEGQRRARAWWPVRERW